MKYQHFFSAYLIDFKKTKKQLWSTLIVTIGSYSVYYFCSDQTIIYLNKENTFYEAGTAVLFLCSALLSFFIFLKTKNKWHLLLSVVFFMGCGEEISWGQQLFKFSTPEALNRINVQKEFNIHNIEIFNSENLDRTYKTGWQRITEINFLFKIFCIAFGIVIPVLNIHFKSFQIFFSKIKLPISPVLLGSFFFLAWLYYQLHLQYLPKGKPIKYYETSSEIYEFLTSFIFLLINYRFWIEIKKQNITNINH